LFTGNAELGALRVTSVRTVTNRRVAVDVPSEGDDVFAVARREAEFYGIAANVAIC
jgi:hypothetical protein